MIFLKVVESGQNITYKFRGDIYWCQGYNKGDKFRMKMEWYHKNTVVKPSKK